MIQIVMKPDYDVKPEAGENLYKCLFNGEDVGLRVRGRKAAHAEEKMMVIFREQLKGKVVDYDLEAYRKSKGEDAGEDAGEAPKSEDSEKGDPMLPGLED
jgi:hypothetical protein